MHEFNPMLGLRGCRLGIEYPEITAMQVRAVIEAALKVAEEGVKPQPEIMIPLVGDVKELKLQRDLRRAGHRAGHGRARPQEAALHLKIGTMIEVPARRRHRRRDRRRRPSSSASAPTT